MKLVRVVAFFALLGAGLISSAYGAVTVTCNPPAGPIEVNVAYSTTCSASGGSGSYNFTTSGLPSYLGPASASGVASITISGTPNSTAAYSFTVTATDTGGAHESGFVSFSGSPGAALSFNCTGAQPREVNLAASLVCSTASTGVGPFTWTLDNAGTNPFPPGVNFNSCTTGPQCTISGTPTAAGTWPYRVRVTDHVGATATVDFPGGIAPELAVSCTGTFPSEMNVAFTTTCTATGGVAPFGWSVNGALPSGVSSQSDCSPGSTTCTIQGTPTQSGSFPYTVQVTDAASAVKSAAAGGTIATAPSISCPSAATPNEENSAFSLTCAASGGSGTYTWDISAGSLPTGVSLSGSCANTANCTIAGTPTVAGQSVAYTLRLGDGKQYVTRPFAGSPIAAALSGSCTASAGTLEVGVPFSYSCNLTGGVAPYAWSLRPGDSVPAGINSPASLTGTSAVWSGTFTTPQSMGFQVRITDSGSTPVTRSFNAAGTIIAGPTFACNTNAAPNEVNAHYRNVCTVSGGTFPYVWTVIPGLPGGVGRTDGPMSTTIEGDPSAAGVVNFTIQVADSATTPQSANRNFNGYIAPAPTVSCSTSGTPEVRSLYTVTCTTNGGVAPYAYSIAPGGSVPPGLAQNTANGSLGGTLTTVGHYAFKVRLIDSASTPATVDSNDVTVDVVAGPSFTCSPSGTLEVGVPYTLACNATGGAGAYTWSGSLPGWLTMPSNTGSSITISGTPGAGNVGSFSFSLEVRDSASPSPVSYVAVQGGNVAARPVMSCNLDSGPNEQGNSYSNTCTISGGTPPYNWATPTLPAGLTFNPSGATATISGAPTGTGSYSFTISAADSATAPQPGSKAFSGSIVTALGISCTQPLGPTQINVPYENTCTASDGATPYAWQISIGSLPAGLAAAAVGPNSYRIAGTPTAAGNYSFRVQLADNASPRVYRSVDYSGTIVAPPSMTCTVTTGPSEQGDPYSTTCTVTGGTPPFTWSVAPGSLPAGVTLTSAGSSATVSGTPAGFGAYSYSVVATDQLSQAASKLFAGDLARALAITCVSNLGPTQKNVPYSNTCSVVAGTGVPGVGYTWSIVNGTLPPGLATSAVTGDSFTVSGTPTTPGNYSYRVQVVDKAAPPVAQSQDFSGTVVAPPSVTCGLTTGPEEQGDPYSTVCTVAGGTAPFTWSIAPGALPAGVTLTPSGASVTIAGTPTGTGPYTYSVKLTDSAPAPQSDSKAFAGNIAPALTMSCTPNVGPTEVNVGYSITCSIGAGTGIAGSGYTWSIVNGSLPPGLVTSSATGTSFTISGTPTTANGFSYRVQVADKASPPVTQSFDFSGAIVARPSITCTRTDGPVQVGVAYFASCSVSGGTPPFTWSILSGTLPQGVSLSPLTGNVTSIAGTPQTTGNEPYAYNYTLKVVDSAKTSAGADASQSTTFTPFAGTITASMIITCTPDVTPTEVGVAYSATCSVAGGREPMHWSIAPGSSDLPAGITMTPSGAGSRILTIAGSPTAAVSNYSYTIRVTDDCRLAGLCMNDQTQEKTFHATIVPQPTFTCTPSTRATSSGAPLEDTLFYRTVCSGSNGTQGANGYAWKITPSTASSWLSVSGGASGSASLGTASQAVTVYGTTIILQGTPPADSGGTTGNPFNYSIVLEDSAKNSAGADAHLTSTLAFSGTTTPAPQIRCIDSARYNGRSVTGPPEQGVTYEAVCTATHGIPPYLWTAPLPAGLNLSASGANNSIATISGVPSASGAYNYTVTFKDANGAADAVSPVITDRSNIFIGSTVAAPTVACDPPTPPLQAGVAYSSTCTVTGGTPPFRWALGSGAPSGLTLSQDTLGAATATISGRVAGNPLSASYSVKVSDSAIGVTNVVPGQLADNQVGMQSQSAVAPFSGIIHDALQITCASSQGPVEVGVPYSTTCTATGGTPVYTFALQGEAPAGLTLSGGPNTVTISGTPVMKGAYNYSVAVTDQALSPCVGGGGICQTPQTVSSPNFVGNVQAAPTVTCDATAGPFQLGIQYTTSCLAVDGAPPYVWSVAPGGQLPSGITIAPNGNRVTISGKPTAVGSYSFALQVADSLDSTGVGPVIANRIAPVLKITTSRSGAFPLRGNGSLLMTVSNTSAEIITGVASAALDLPVGLNAIAAESDGSWTCNVGGSRVTCDRANNAPLGAGLAYPPVTLTVAVSDQACSAGASVKSSVALDGAAQAASSETISATGCLAISKTHSGSFPASGTGAYSLVVSNSASVPVGGAITVTDELDPQLTGSATGASGDGWTCSMALGENKRWRMTCARSDTADPNSAFPPITMTVNVASGACFVSDIATVQLGDLAQASAKDPTSIAGAGCVRMTADFTLSAGTGSAAAGTYAVKVANVGEGTITDPLTVSLTVPSGLTVSGTGDAAWQCDSKLPTLSCTRSGSLAGGKSAALSVSVTGSLSCGVVSAQASLVMNGQTQSTVSIPTSIPGNACLALSRKHEGMVTAGGKGAYLLTVSNPDPSNKVSAPIRVMETLPPGITPIGISTLKDTGWDCKISGQNIDCSRSDELAAATSFPAVAVTFDAGSAACPGYVSTAYLSVNGSVQSAGTDSTAMIGCFSLEQKAATAFNIDQSAGYILTVGYLGQNAVDGTLSVQQTLPGGLTPVGFTNVDGTAFGEQDWSCVVSTENSQKFTCTRPATGTYTPILVTVGVGIDACPFAASQASLQLDGATQTQSNSALIPVLGACPGIKLTVKPTQDTNPPGGVFTPNMQGGAAYKLIVTNSSAEATDGPVVLTDQFNPGLRPTAVEGSGWTCSPAAQIVTCNRADSLAPGESYPPILISVAVDPGACPSAQDSVALTLSGKTQYSAPNTVNLRGCVNLSPSSVSYSPVTLGGEPAVKSITLTASDKDPLTVTVHPLPSTSPFSLSSADCKELASGKDCKVQLLQGKSLVLDAAYKPNCIGAQTDTIRYETDVPSSGGIALSGQALFQNLSFVQLPGGQNLANSTVSPNTSINMGLNVTPGYCLTGDSTVTPRILFSEFQRPDDGRPLQYDENVVACPSGTAGCLGTLKTGTVAGVITLSAQFTDGNGQDVGYPGDASVQLTVPAAKPALIEVKKGATSQSSFQLAVTGYSTPRKETEACFKFTPAPGTQLNTSGLNSCYAKDDIAVWYERTTSIATGSQFTTNVTFSFAGDAAAIGTVETWVRNSLGESERLCLDFKTGSAKAGACQ